MAKKIDFPMMVQDGENPHGVRVETPEGVSHGGIGEDYYTQWTMGPNNAGDRWGGPAPTLLPSGLVGVAGMDRETGNQNKGKTLKGGR